MALRVGASTPLSQVCHGIQIFKGPRLKSENLIVDGESDDCEPYYTPTAVLQEKSDSVKNLKISRASAAQLAVIKAVRVHHGDIVVTRSGSIGRVAIITPRLNGAIVSDDLIRVRIPDELWRSYILFFLQSQYARDQMLRNEYGAVQQHLEPMHIRNLLIPVPDDPSELQAVVDKAKLTVQLRERLEAASADAMNELHERIGSLIKQAAGINS